MFACRSLHISAAIWSPRQAAANSFLSGLRFHKARECRIHLRPPMGSLASLFLPEINLLSRRGVVTSAHTTTTTRAKRNDSPHKEQSKPHHHLHQPKEKNPVKDKLQQREEDKKKMGLSTELLDAFHKLRFTDFTSIQRLGIPHILRRKDTVLAAQTGTGKTLAYLLPIFQLLKLDEKTSSSRPGRPRALILLPNRELAIQVLGVVKSLSHHIKLRSGSITSNTKLALQKTTLRSTLDILVATPGKFLQNMERERVWLSDLRYLVVDESDTLFDTSFQEDLNKFLQIIKKREQHSEVETQSIVVTATLTADVVKGINEYFPKAKWIATEGLHKTLSRLQHNFVYVPTPDKHDALLNALKEGKGRTVVFCNDIASCRSTHHFLTEQGFQASCLHSDIPAKRREEYFESFVSGQSPFLVCTDIFSRGLDTTAVGHVVLFDFPRSAADYLHRVGRTARAGKPGLVTCLLRKGERVLGEAIDKASKKSIGLHQVAPLFEKESSFKKEKLAAWLRSLQPLPSS